MRLRQILLKNGVVSNRKVNRATASGCAFWKQIISADSVAQKSDGSATSLESFSDSNRERVSFSANGIVYAIVDVVLFVELESQANTGSR